MQAVAGVGAITAAADLVGAFKTGTDAGIARIGRSWLGYAGYEVGGNIACKIAKLVPRVGAVAPMLIGGIACSHLFDTLLGSSTEDSIAQLIAHNNVVD